MSKENDTFSQSEIDALVDAVQTEVGQTDGKESKTVGEYKKYDFNRPEKFSQENLKSLETISTTFAKTVSQTLSARLRNSIQVDFLKVEQVPFASEYANPDKKGNFVFCIIDMGNPDIHEIIFEIDLAFVVAIHDRLLGGVMKNDKNKKMVLSDIEQITLGKLLKSIIFPDLEDSLDSLGETTPKYVKYESDPALLRVTAAMDMVAVVEFKVAYNECESIMRLVFPFQNIEGIIDRLTTEKVREMRPVQKMKNYRQEIAKGLGNVEEDVHVSVGETVMTLDELSQIQIGDYIVLNNKVDIPSRVYAAGVHKFNGFIGRNKNKKAFRFVDFQISEDEVEAKLKEIDAMDDETE